jgi:hypothetical protein
MSLPSSPARWRRRNRNHCCHLRPSDAEHREGKRTQVFSEQIPLGQISAEPPRIAETLPITVAVLGSPRDERIATAAMAQQNHHGRARPPSVRVCGRKTSFTRGWPIKSGHERSTISAWMGAERLKAIRSIYRLLGSFAENYNSCAPHAASSEGKNPLKDKTTSGA